ncbi:MAG: TIGR03905 family TSCPD domain-containing protein [Firmicutes bacterium]|nr:TIGR03905 family TSCPD domain-containing protein [Bacillota bacterium]
MTYTYRPKGVCSQLMEIETEGGILKSFSVMGGCEGNLKGIARLVEGMPVDEVIRRLEGIHCGFKNTSCPDQLAKALKAIQAEADA